MRVIVLRDGTMIDVRRAEKERDSLYLTRDFDLPLRHVHHSNPHFYEGRGRSLFLAKGYKLTNNSSSSYFPASVKNKSIQYNDEDRLIYHDWDRYWKAARKARLLLRFQNRHHGSAAFYQYLLRFLYNDPDLKLVHIIGWVHQMTGQDYKTFGYITKKPLDVPKEGESP